MKYKKRNTYTLIYTLAAAFHPAFKLKWIDDEDIVKKREVMDLMRKEKEIIEEQENVFEFHEDVQPTQPEKAAKFSLDYQDEENDDISYVDEIEKWCKTRLTNIEDLENNPFIKKGFLKYNTALCSQAGVERSFSFGKLVFGQLRRNLYDENFEKHLIMKANRKLNPKLFEKTE